MVRGQRALHLLEGSPAPLQQRHQWSRPPPQLQRVLRPPWVASHQALPLHLPCLLQLFVQQQQVAGRLLRQRLLLPVGQAKQHRVVLGWELRP